MRGVSHRECPGYAGIPEKMLMYGKGAQKIR